MTLCGAGDQIHVVPVPSAISLALSAYLIDLGAHALLVLRTFSGLRLEVPGVQLDTSMPSIHSSPWGYLHVLFLSFYM